MSILDEIANPIQPIDVGGTLLRMQQLQNARTQNQGAQLENQQRGLAIQQQQQELNDQQAMTKAMQSWDGSDYNALPGLVLKSGGSAKAVMGLKSAIVKQQQDLTSLSAAQLANEKTKNDYFAQSIDNVKQLPPEQQAAGFEAAKADAVRRGYLDQQTAQGLQYQGPDQLDLLEKSFLGHSGAIATAEKQSTANKNNADANLANASAREKGMMVPVDAPAAKVLNVPVGSLQPLAVVQKARETANVGMENVTSNGRVQLLSKIDPSMPARDLGTAPAVTTFNLQNAGLNGQKGQPSAMAQAIAAGQMKWNDVVSARTPMPVKEALLKEVKGINPNFNSGDFDVEKKVREAFTSGADSNTLNSINRAREHMHVFLQTAKDLDNGSVQAFNQVGQAFNTQFGSDKASNFTIAKQAFSSEVGKAFAGASVAEGDRKEIGDKITAASSYEQLAGVAKTADALLAGAQKVLKQKYDQGTQGVPNFGGGAGAHVIQIGNKQYQYKGTGATDDLSNYTEIPK